MTPVVARLVARWRADRHAAQWLRPGATLEQLAAFETRHGVALPPAFRDLYAATDGMVDGTFDDTMTCLAPLGEVVPLRQHRFGESTSSAWSDRWFVFADYLISSHLFLIRLDADRGNSGPVVGWDGGSTRWPISPTIVDFSQIGRLRTNGPS